MKQTWIIAKRELFSFFDSLTAYIMIVAFLGFSGFFTWLFGRDIFLVGQASLQVFFGISFWTLFFFIPAITMKLLAEEKRAGTLELLLTKPINQIQIVGGKFIATLMLILISLVLTLPYYISVASIGPIDHGAVICGYLGLLLISSVYIGIGIMASSFTNNQIVSFLLALLIGVFFHFIFGMLGSSMTGFLGSFFMYLGADTHFESIARGVIDSKDILYFLSIVAICFAVAVYSLTRKNS